MAIQPGTLKFQCKIKEDIVKLVIITDLCERLIEGRHKYLNSP